MKKLLASIMTADQLNLETEIESLLQAGVNWLHCDVMDGIFVNNLAMGPYIIEKLKEFDGITIDIHLATVKPNHFIRLFGPLKPDYLTFHIETTDNVFETIRLIKSFDCKVGIALSPNTPFEEVLPFIAEIDLILFMTVNPGFAGQKFKVSVIEKMRAFYNHCNKKELLTPLIQVDGNINSETIKMVRGLGVNLYVLGTSALFNEVNKGRYLETIQKLTALINE